MKRSRTASGGVTCGPVAVSRRIRTRARLLICHFSRQRFRIRWRLPEHLDALDTEALLADLDGAEVVEPEVDPGRVGEVLHERALVEAAACRTTTCVGCGALRQVAIRPAKSYRFL
jgi:hypothetical protein